jgi:hypothetical protein
MNLAILMISATAVWLLATIPVGKSIEFFSLCRYVVYFEGPCVVSVEGPCFMASLFKECGDGA